MKPAIQLTFASQSGPIGERINSLAALLFPNTVAGWILLSFLVLILLGACALAWRLIRVRLHGPGEKFSGELAMLRAVMASVPDLIYVCLLYTSRCV